MPGVKEQPNKVNLKNFEVYASVSLLYNLAAEKRWVCFGNHLDNSDLLIVDC
jgi:hypothetical protein